MKGKYFKPRQRFSNNPHKYDLGTYVISKETHRDRFFLNKLIELPEWDFLGLYDYHSVYYQEKSEDKEEARKEFFSQIIRLLEKEYENEKMKVGTKLSSKQKSDNDLRLDRYRSFLQLIKKERDEWGIIENDTQGEKIKKMENELVELKKEGDNIREENRKLKKEREKLRVLKRYRISLKKGERETFLNLIHQLIELELPGTTYANSNKLLSEKVGKTWSKIISNHFIEDGEEIPFETARSYFTSDKNSKWYSKYQKFKIVPKKNSNELF